MRSWILGLLRRGVLFITIFSLFGCGILWRQVSITYIAIKYGGKDIEISLYRAFIERYKNRVTILTRFTVDKAMKSPNPAFVDGDLHFSGRSPDVALPSVGEITNAASHQAAIDLVHRVEGKRTPLRVSGVWRIWPEHAGATPEVQGQPAPAYTMTNPEHVFEIHPVLRINHIGLLDSLRPVSGFKPGAAQRTFDIYEKATCMIRVEPRTVFIVTKTGLYNDVEFIMELVDARQEIVGDGRFVMASVRDLDGNLLVKRVRTVFAKGTDPERAVRLLKRGARLHVGGIPRLDLAEVSRRVLDSRKNPAVLNGALPYEIIITGVYPKEK